MKLFIPKEKEAVETRVALLPTDTGKLIRLGADIEVQAGIGESINISDEDYEKAGSQISSDYTTSLAGADLVLRINVPNGDYIQNLSEGCIHVSCMDPFNNADLVKEFATRKVSAISLEMIPRTTIA